MLDEEVLLEESLLVESLFEESLLVESLFEEAEAALVVDDFLPP